LNSPGRLEAALFHAMQRIALATSRKFVSLTDDDRLLIEPLRSRGFAAEPAVWSDPDVHWSGCDAVILRSCWDYHLRLAEFLAWVGGLEKAGVRLWNPPEMVRWNANKNYLRDLESRGIPVVPTFWPEQRVSLPEQLRSLGWDRAVIKPRVSATAHRTMLVSADDAADAQSLADELLAGPGVMVQQFMDGIRTSGEWSLVFFSAEFSHAVIKIPKAGDFRVQHDFGGSEESAEPPREIREAAARVIAALEQPPLYARVDGVESGGRFLLMELELIEPALFLGFTGDAAHRFAKSVADHLG